jgi:hypothetical protein
MSGTLFPGQAGPPVVVDDDPEDVDLNREEAAYDFREVEWESPEDMTDDDMAMIQRLLGDNGVTVLGDAEAPEGVRDTNSGPWPAADEDGWM